MKKFEYKEITGKIDNSHSVYELNSDIHCADNYITPVQMLNEAGMSGWELVTMQYTKNDPRFEFFISTFKRELIR